MPDMERIKEWAVADQKGTAPAEVSAWLRGEGLDLWIDALVDLVQHVDAEISGRKAELAELSAAGMSTDEWRRADAELQRWKHSAMTFKRHSVGALKEAKRLVRERAVAEHEAESDLRGLCLDMADLLDALAERVLDGADLDRAEALLERVPDWLDASVSMRRATAARKAAMAQPLAG